MDIVVKVRVAEGVEIEVRGGPDVFNAAIDELPNMVSKLRSALAPRATVPAQPEASTQTIDVENFPSIEKPKGTQDAIYKVVSSSWGRSKPRTAKEIDPVLKANGVHISEGSLTGSLTLLVQSGKLRRLKVGSMYAYTQPLSSNGN